MLIKKDGKLISSAEMWEACEAWEKTLKAELEIECAELRIANRASAPDADGVRTAPWSDAQEARWGDFFGAFTTATNITIEAVEHTPVQ
jgi:hypothetical protein